MLKSVKKFYIGILTIGVFLNILQLYGFREKPKYYVWSEKEKNVLRSLWIGSLEKLTPDLSNHVADDSLASVLGQLLFFDSKFSKNKSVSCSSCHQPGKLFTDGLPLSTGLSELSRHTPSIIASAYSPWLYWDGRRDNLWSQALTPMEAKGEMEGNRSEIVRFVLNNKKYKTLLEKIFGTLPTISETQFPASPRGSDIEIGNWKNLEPREQKNINMVFAFLGKSLEAYVRKIQFGTSRFDQYVSEVLNNSPGQESLSISERNGLRIFISEEAKCLRCHNGPLFTNSDFHNTGVNNPKGTVPDLGRMAGIYSVIMDEFNCAGPYSDAKPSDCGELRFLNQQQPVMGAFKVPSLRNVALTAPYMHNGSFPTLDSVLEHYRNAPQAIIGQQELIPFNFSAEQKKDLINFLHTLNTPIATDKKYLTPSN